MKIFLTGSAGFIGYHAAARLLTDGHSVLGLDAMTGYYDPGLKRARLSRLMRESRYSHVEAYLEDSESVLDAIESFRPDVVLHLAAQAGVRHSLEDPDAYINSNVVGTQNLLNAIRDSTVTHLLMASSSSVYGESADVPFREKSRADEPLSLYAATKKTGEALVHAHSHLFGTPSTCFRFFTVYGPWGRPDMSLFRFVEAMREERLIDLYGEGQMRRDFTYIGDLVDAIIRLMGTPPSLGSAVSDIDSLSGVAPFRVVNIGTGSPVGLFDFVSAVERAMGVSARVRLLPMQPGDAQVTHADNSLLRQLTAWEPRTSLDDGVEQFVRWYEAHYKEHARPTET